jgi:hypothetical protein
MTEIEFLWQIQNHIQFCFDTHYMTIKTRMSLDNAEG